MKIKINKVQIKKISKQVSVELLPSDELEEFCIENHYLPKKDLESLIWRTFGPFKDFSDKKVVTFFTTKGGVLKTSLAFNFSRIAALSGIKTLVLGLDMQADMTNCIAGQDDDHDTIEAAIERKGENAGLFEFFNRQVTLDQTIHTTDLDYLDYIPEAPQLALLNDGISLLNRREYWLKDKVISPLKDRYDLIVLDCSPNWNRLTTNALSACDQLVSPIECKINNFKNLEVFQKLMQDIKDDLALQFNHLYVPTRYSKTKKLGREILQWYKKNLENCAEGFIRESIESEEAIALQQSILEYRPSSKCSDDFKLVLGEIVKSLTTSKKVNISLHVGDRDLFRGEDGFISQ